MEAEERPKKIRKLSYEHSVDTTPQDSIPAADYHTSTQEHSPENRPTLDSGNKKLDASRIAPGTAEGRISAPASPFTEATPHISEPEPEEHTSDEARDTAGDDTGNIATFDASARKLHVPPGCQVPQIDPTTGQPLSKNQQKKLRRQQQWEAKAGERKVKKKEQVKAKKVRKREQREADAAAGLPLQTAKSQQRSQQMPVTFLFDCDFEGYMYDKELISLAAQLTRAYSDNRSANYRAHLAVSSYGGKLKERFENVLARSNESWKGVKWLSDDFAQASKKAKEWMIAENGGRVAAALLEASKDVGKDALVEQGEVVYLTTESDDILNELKPYSTYIIGGVVDKNRHKGLCYKRAKEKGMKTAKLPIGEFMQMSSRQVLATNHVAEIMLKWMEFGDWGKAFDQVIPKRKGGTLKTEFARGERLVGEGKSAHSDAAEDGDEADASEDCGDASNKAIENTAELVQPLEGHEEATALSQSNI